MFVVSLMYILLFRAWLHSLIFTLYFDAVDFNVVLYLVCLLQVINALTVRL